MDLSEDVLVGIDARHLALSYMMLVWCIDIREVEKVKREGKRREGKVSTDAQMGQRPEVER